MNLVDEIKKLEAFDIVIVFGIFLATLSPGFLTLYLFKPNLVTQLDTAKILLFSAALGLPLFVLNVLILTAILDFKEMTLRVSAFVASVLTILAFYAALIFTHTFQFQFLWFLISLAVANAVVYLGMTVLALINHWSKKKKGS